MGPLNRALLVFFGVVIMVALVAVGWALSREPVEMVGEASSAPTTSPALPAVAASPAPTVPTASPSPAEVVEALEAEEVVPPPRKTAAPRSPPPTASPQAPRGRVAVLAWLRAHHFRAEDVALLLPIPAIWMLRASKFA